MGSLGNACEAKLGGTKYAPTHTPKGTKVTGHASNTPANEALKMVFPSTWLERPRLDKTDSPHSSFSLSFSFSCQLISSLLISSLYNNTSNDSSLEEIPQTQ